MKNLLLLLLTLFALKTQTEAQCNASFTTFYANCDSVWFAPDSANAQYNYFWDFGDGATSIDVISTHQYTSDGTYPVVLTVVDSVGNCANSFTSLIVINCGGGCTTNGDFYALPDTVSCAVFFTSTAFGGTAPYTYAWNFGDGTTSTAAHPTHTYSNAGTYTPCLTVTDAQGCDTTICHPVTVNCTSTSCDATFTTYYANCDSLWFTPATTGSQYSYFWNFGDGITSTDMITTHQFSANGTYSVYLVITDSLNNCYDIFTFPVVINCAGCNLNGAAISSYTDSTCATQFVSTVSGGVAPYSYNWNFGDGAASTLANPSHVYAPGTYTVLLTITDANGCDTTAYQVVTVNCSSTNCNATFTASGITCDSIWFYPSSLGSQYDYFWDFGDGTYSTSMTPAHQFSGNGVYYVVLTVIDSTGNCSDVFTQAVTINCNNGCTVDGDFYAVADTMSCAVYFTSTAFGGTAPYTYSWNFGDGNTSTVAHPTHIYGNAGTYTPCLTITDAQGCDTTICYPVTVTCNQTPCSAVFTTYYVSCDSLWFTPATTGSQYTYFWNFGDGTTSTDMIATHQFTSNGTYPVYLVITDSLNNCYDIFTFPVTINCGGCNLDGVISSYTDSSCVTQFTSTITGGTAPYTYYWAFGDGGTSTLANPSHTYTPGVYTVLLNVMDSNGCDTTIYQVVTVNCSSANNCSALFTASAITCDSIWFYPSSLGSQYDYFWDFGDGTYSTSMTPAHQFSGNGVYYVVLTVIDSTGNCSDVFTQAVTINCNNGCTVDGDFYAVADTMSCAVYFTSTAFGGTAPYTYSWNFGDGNTSTVAHPTHIYGNAGTYTPCLTITDAQGCDTTICYPVTVSCNQNSCTALFTAINISCDSIWFVPASQGAQYDYFWNFGDGTYSSNMTPAHQYNANGTYYVVLTVIDSVGNCSDVYTFPLTINCGGSGCTVDGAVYAYPDSMSCAVFFSSTAFGGTAPYTFAWDFGDGTTSADQHPTHFYQGSGVYTTCLTITDAQGCDTTICQPVTVLCNQGTCSAVFTAINITCDSIWFYPASIGSQYNYFWDFGDGSYSSDVAPAHQFTANGTYPVVLVISDSLGNCTDVYTFLLTVNCFLGIEDQQTQVVNLYPNPTSEGVNVVADDMQRIDIYNMEGRLVYTENVMDNQVWLGLEELSDGIYMIHVTTANGIATEKLMKR